MLRIRLRRVGKKGKPSYRIVVAESSAPRDGAYVEWIGNYDPMTDPPTVTLKADRAADWLSKGAQPSDAVMRIFDWNGLLKRTPEQRARTQSSDAQAEESAAPAAVAVAEEEAAPAAVAVAEETEDDEAAAPSPEEETGSEATAAEVTDELTDESTGEATPDEAAEESSDSEAGSEVTDEASEDGDTSEVSTE